MIHNGLSKKSFDLRYKIAPKFNLLKTDATLENGLLEIFKKDGTLKKSILYVDGEVSN